MKLVLVFDCIYFVCNTCWVVLTKLPVNASHLYLLNDNVRLCIYLHVIVVPVFDCIYFVCNTYVVLLGSFVWANE